MSKKNQGKKEYNWKTFPQPDCPYGYSVAFIEEILDEETLQEFKFWMRGQTMSICGGRRYNHELRQYEPDECEKTPHGGVVYLYDLHRFLGFLGHQHRNIWD